MKKVLTAMTATGIAATTAMAGASATIDFANAHIFRGYTAADEFVIQPAVEFAGFGMPEEYGSFALGAWGSVAPFADEDTGLDTAYETDWYLMYYLPELVEGLDLYLGLTEYAYSSGSLNESEFNLGAGYEIAGFAVEASFNYIYKNQGPDAIRFSEGQMYIPISADYGLDLSEDFDVSVGALISFMMQGEQKDTVLDDGFNHYEIYGAIGYDLSDIWTIGFSLAYIGQGDDAVLPDADSIIGAGTGGHDVSVLGMLSVGAEL